MLTVDEIIKEAMQELGELASGETPTTIEYNDGLVRLNTLIATIREGTPLTDTESIVLSATQTEYPTAIGTKRVVSFHDTTYNMMSPEAFDKYGADDEGNLYIDYSQIPPRIVLGQAPGADKAGDAVHYRREFVPSALVLGQSPNFNDGAQDMLIVGLAYRLAPQYNVPMEVRMGLKSDYEELHRDWKSKQTARTSRDVVRPLNVV